MGSLEEMSFGERVRKRGSIQISISCLGCQAEEGMCPDCAAFAVPWVTLLKELAGGTTRPNNEMTVRELVDRGAMP